MADVEHSAMGGNANQHAIHRWAHADQAARYAQAVSAADVGKVSKQASDNTYWVLVDDTNVANAAGWKSLVSGIPAFEYMGGCVAATGTTSSRYIPRTQAAAGATVTAAEVPIGKTGTFTFTLTWRVAGTPLATDTVALAVMKNQVATALTATVPAATVSGQASASLSVTAGDSIALRLIQSSTEAQAAWNFGYNIRAET